jgi:hypothetical protein
LQEIEQEERDQANGTRHIAREKHFSRFKLYFPAHNVKPVPKQDNHRHAKRYHPHSPLSTTRLGDFLSEITAILAEL